MTRGATDGLASASAAVDPIPTTAGAVAAAVVEPGIQMQRQKHWMIDSPSDYFASPNTAK